MRKMGTQIKYMFLISLLVFLIFGQNTIAFATENPEKAKTVIRVGYTDNDQMIQKRDGQFTGYGVAYLELLASYTDWKFEYVPVAEENRMNELKSGNIQLLCDVSEDESDENHFILSKESSCMHYALLCAKENDTTIFFNEFTAINGKRIAINKTHNMEHILENFAQEHQITYTPVYCTNLSEMETAVEEGRADLLLTSNQRKLDGYKYVANIGLREQFFAVSESHPEIMEQINHADQQIKLKRPFTIAGLYETYYGRPGEILTGTTREEYDFVQNKTPVRVVCDGGSFPIAYIDETTGEYSGIYADAMALIEKESGLNFEFIPLTKYKNSWDMLKSGEADMSSSMYINENMRKKYGLMSSSSYMNTNYTLILQVDTAFKDGLKIALPANYAGIQAFVKEHYPTWEIIQAKDTDDCLKMADSGAADGTLINSVFLQTKHNINNYANLIVFPMHSVDIPISSAFAGPNAELLRQIVNKAIKRIPSESFENCIIENSVKISYEPTTMDIIRKSFPFIVLIVLIFVIIYLLTLWYREQHYRHLAMTDSLTGLWNGIYFRQNAKETLLHNYQKNYQMISMDLEHFKYVYTDFSEKTADNVLQSIGKRLRQLFGSDAIYAREMGDMFLILTEENDHIADILYELGNEITFDNNGVKQCYTPDIKFGICTIAAASYMRPVNEYIDHAVAARKSIKGNPAQDIAYYDNKMAEVISREAWIEKKMESALRQGEFIVYYQPKYLLRSEKIVGAEALVRWHNPEEGMIFPNEFIPLFERNGFIVQLDFYVYEEVLKTIAKWMNEGKKNIVVSVNVSRAHIGTSDFLSKLIKLADRYQVPHELLELELTETVLGGERNDVVDFIRNCKANGFPISIDDFGSGYSSLNLLKELPVDVLKIDREFLNETEVSEKSSIIIEQIVQMAEKIHIHTLCEGVETRSQADFLNRIGCNMAQGYLYSKPVPLENFEVLLNSGINACL